MENFIYNNSTTIIFGKNTHLNVGRFVKEYGSNILFHYGGGSIKKTGLYETVIKSLNAEGIKYTKLGGVKPNPRLSLVKEGIKICKNEKIDFILAVGGGSVIDSAKAIAIGSRYDGDVWDFYLRKAKIKDALSIGVVLTIPAAGSESSTGSVITNEDGWYKRSAGSLIIRPKFAIMNPELTYTLPPFQTASGISDMLAHVFERYFTNTPNVEFTDRLCEATITTIIEQGKKVIENPLDYNLRAQIMWAGSIAHNGLLGTGREEDWASHGIEHELSGIYDLTHGAGLAIIFPAWMKYVYHHDVRRFMQFAHRIFNVDDIEEAINKLIAFYQALGLPTLLSEVNISSQRFEEMARKATENGPLGSFVKLEYEDIINILNLAL